MIPGQTGSGMTGSGMVSGGGAGYSAPIHDAVNYAKNPEPRRANSIAGEIDTAEKRLSHLHAVIDTLTQRLDGVLAPVPPQTGAASPGSAPLPQMSKVVTVLRAQGYQLEAATMRLQELADRLEL